MSLSEKMRVIAEAHSHENQFEEEIIMNKAEEFNNIAIEARMIANKLYEEQANVIIEKALTEARKGMYRFYLYKSIHPKTKEILTKNGFKVEETVGRNETSTTISW
jgi:uncharacterized protein YcfL